MGRSSWTDFKLLIWKNCLLKSRHKKEFAIEIIIPIIFCLILLIIRSLVVPIYVDTPTTYPPVYVDTLSLLREYVQPTSIRHWELSYTPQNPLLEKIVKIAANKLNVRYKAFDNPQSLESYVVNNHSFAGVVFDSNMATIESYPISFKFAIRLSGSLRTARHLNEFSTWMTKSRFHVMHHQGPRNNNHSDGGLPPGYIREGFIAIQNAISTAYITLAAEERVELPKIVLRRYPFPAYIDDPLLIALESMAAMVIVLSFVYPVTQAVKYITTEKETQLKEAMKIMGLSSALHWGAWFCTLAVGFLITITTIIAVLKVPWFQGFTVAVLNHTSWSLLFVFLSIYAVAATSFCFMVSSFFYKANIAAAIGGLLWFTFYIPYSFSMRTFISLPLRLVFGASLFLNAALPFGFKIILKWEATNVGANWSNLFKTVNIEESLSLGYAMIMLLFDSVLYMLIAAYVEQVMPGGYGVPLKWYFPFTCNFWSPSRVTYVEECPDGIIMDPERFEPELQNNKSVGIRLRHLRKHFGSKVAVDGLRMDMYEGHITVLLGHNGAGKTTTVSMITGMFPPSSGTVFINNLDILKNIKEVRQNLGFCPQHNILFDELTVREHIIFYSRLKGFSDHLVEAEVEKYLKLLDFEDKRDAEAGTLSGGMKRKLSVGVALCGNSKVVVFDEPTSGLDPAARRALWDLLVLEKKGRTILLTTHFMDEADILGDRIFIMSLGKLKCGGTPFFLKKKFGTGYQLICSKNDKCKPEKVTALLHRFVKNITLRSDVGNELSYQLPEKYVHVFEPMLRELEQSQNELGLNGYGISMTTLEDVFMKTGCELSDDLIENGGPANETIEHYPRKKSMSALETSQSVQLVGPLTRIGNHWKAMFLKKYYYFIRHWYTFFIQVGIPLFFIVSSIYVSKSMGSSSELPPLDLNLDFYDRTTTLLEITAIENSTNAIIGENYGRIFPSLVGDHLLLQVTQPMIQQILSFEKESLINTRYLVAATMDDDGITGWFNNEALHTAPIALNLIYNAIAKTLLGNDYSIEVVNEPLPYSANFRMQLLKGTRSLGFNLSMNLTFAMSFVSAIFVMFLIKERESRAKLLQFVSGVRFVTFWLVHFISDFIVYVIISLCVVLVLFAFQEEGFSAMEDLEKMFVLFIAYGFASLPFTYLISFLYDDPATGLSRLAIYNVFTGNALYIVVFILSLPVIELGHVAKRLKQYFLVFPNFALAQGISNQAALATTRDICDMAHKVSGFSLNAICSLVLPECCRLKPYGLENPGIGWILISLALVGLVFLVLLFAVEFFETNMFKRLLNWISRRKLLFPSLTANEDQDVTDERANISILNKDDSDKQMVVLQDVTKYYGKFLAVSRLSIGIKRGECFGLLGINGAGKTSTFKMLTGDISATFGDVRVNGLNTKQDMNSIYKMIGYCPQFDGLFMDLTGKETLRIYSLLRGVPAHAVNRLTNILAKELAFHKHLTKKVKNYSGGNRRKLSTAIAILGNPQVIYLDEPTTGIDPASRRKLWDIICFVRDLGKGIVLTSHSMEECEALCTRIAIMVDGQLKCIGSTQHLKNKFSQGIALSVKLKTLGSHNGYYDYRKESLCLNTSRPELSLDKYGRNVYNFIIQRFDGAVLRDCHKNLLTFEIPSNVMSYSQIFGLMEASKENLKSKTIR